MTKMLHGEVLFWDLPNWGAQLPNWFSSILSCHLASPAHPLGLLLSLDAVVYIYIVYIPNIIHNGYMNGIHTGTPVLYTHSNGLGISLLCRLDRYTIDMVIN